MRGCVRGCWARRLVVAVWIFVCSRGGGVGGVEGWGFGKKGGGHGKKRGGHGEREFLYMGIIIFILLFPRFRFSAFPLLKKNICINFISTGFRLRYKLHTYKHKQCGAQIIIIIIIIILPSPTLYKKYMYKKITLFFFES